MTRGVYHVVLLSRNNRVAKAFSLQGQHSQAATRVQVSDCDRNASWHGECWTHRNPIADLRRRPKQPLDDFTLLDHNHSWMTIVNTIADNDFRSVPDDFGKARHKMNEWTMVGFVEHF